MNRQNEGQGHMDRLREKQYVLEVGDWGIVTVLEPQKKSLKLKNVKNKVKKKKKKKKKKSGL